MEKILIIEDDIGVRTTLNELLKNCGYETIVAENGKQALELVEKTIPDIVISDLMMPEIDGLAFLKLFRDKVETVDVPFIFLTARNDYSDIRTGMGSGADDYLVKPFKAVDLLKVVRYRLDKKNREYENIKKIQSNISSFIPKALNTPLVAIQGFADLIIEDYNVLKIEDIVDYVKKIKSSAVELQNRIQKYYTFTESMNIFSDTSLIEKSKYDKVKSIRELILDIVENERKIYENEIVTEINVADTPLDFNKKITKTIFRELIENAFKYTFDKKIRITGALIDNYYKIEIISYGKAIDNKIIQNINSYIIFKQELQTIQNVGLGLLIAKNLIQVLNGELKIDQLNNEATLVQVLLPIIKV